MNDRLISFLTSIDGSKVTFEKLHIINKDFEIYCYIFF